MHRCPLGVTPERSRPHRRLDGRGLVLLAHLAALWCAAPEARAASCMGIPIAPGQSIQAAVNANPAGTTFCIQAGIHRLQQVIPKDGDRFIGEYGAILSGATVLPASSFVQSGSVWYIDGQTQYDGWNIVPNNLDPGYACDDYSEELFVDNSTRLRHVCTLAELAPGKWYFDYAADRIYLQDNPASFSIIETSVKSAAFYGDGVVKNVLIENLIIEKYASQPGAGAVGSRSRGNPGTVNWTVRYNTIRYNHGTGLALGKGMIAEHNKIHDNGQMGIVSREIDKPVTNIIFRNNEVFRNKVLNYRWGWEGGGSKLKNSDGALVENNWFHDNIGPGLWFDISNRNTTIRSNLVENTNPSNRVQAIGIFYEVSFGPAKIYWNRVGYSSDSNIYNSNSSGVEIYENVIFGSGLGIRVQHANRSSEGIAIQTSADVHHNDSATTASDFVWLGSTNGTTDIISKVLFYSNTYRGASSSDARFRVNGWNCCPITFPQWKGYGLDTNGTIVSSGTAVFPAGAVPFTVSPYGPQPSTGGTPPPTLSLSANPPSILQGGSSTLTWSSTNATGCTASNGWSGIKAISGTQNVTPVSTTTYTLSCTGSGGSATQNATVTVSSGSSPQLLLHSTLDSAVAVTSPLVGAGVGSSVVTSPLNDFVLGRIGNGLRVDAKGEYASFQQTDGVKKNVNIARGTVDFWYQPGYNHDDGNEYMFFQTARRTGPSGSTVTTAGALEIGKHNAGNGNSLMIIYWDANKTRWESTVRASDYGWNAGDWVNIRVSWDWTVAPGVRNIRAYLNGAELNVIGRDPGDPPHTGPKSTVPESTAQNIYIGGQPVDGGGLWLANGVADELKIYDAPLPPPMRLPGDLDGDGDADLSDLRLLIQMIVGQTLPNLTTADLDADGQLTLGDVRELINILISP